MDSEQFQTLLPWLANNTLAPADREAMIAYLAAHPEARGEVRETAMAMATLGGHPRDEWLAETARDTPFEHRTAVLNHLTTCDECAEIVALARVAHLTPLADERAQVATPEAANDSFPVPSKKMPSAVRAVALAAMLLAGIGLGRFWTHLDAPPAQVIVAEVAAPDAGSIAALRALPVSVVPSTLRGEGEEADLLLGPDRDAFLVDVQIPKSAESVSALSARLETADGELVTALVPGPRFDGHYINVAIPAADLVADRDYVLILEDAATGETIDRYDLRSGAAPASDAPAATSP